MVPICKMIGEWLCLILLIPANKHHGTGRRPKIRFVDAMPLVLFAHPRADIKSQILIAGIFSQQTAQIMIFLAAKAGAEFSISGQAYARAVSAKGLCDRSDQADFAGRSVDKTIFAG